MIFDTHAHYDDDAFDEDREELLKSLPEHGVHRVVNVGASIESTRYSIQLAKDYPFIYGAVGVHPSECGKLTEAEYAWLAEAVKLPKIVAVGEIGLDYYWEEPSPDIQKHWFERQLTLAEDSGLPVIIHSRDAAKDTLDIIKGHRNNLNGGVVHCYSYSAEMAREYLDMGFYIGIGGVVTFKNAKKLKEVVSCVPLDSIVLETDCPYLAPVPNRGKRNSSLNLPYIAEEIANIKQIGYDEVINATYNNAMKLYGL